MAFDVEKRLSGYASARRHRRLKSLYAVLLGAMVIAAVAVCLTVSGISMTQDDLDAPQQDTSSVAEPEISMGEENPVSDSEDADFDAFPEEGEGDVPDAEHGENPAKASGADAQNEAQQGESARVEGDVPDAQKDDKGAGGEQRRKDGEAPASATSEDPDEPEAQLGEAALQVEPEVQDVTPMPAQHFEDALEDAKGNTALAVYVDAPEGAFPQGATMDIASVKPKKVASAVDEALADGQVSGEVDAIQAVDITFADADGREIEPAAEVVVTFWSPRIAQAAQDDAAHEPVVVHVDDQGEAAMVDPFSKKALKNRGMELAEGELAIGTADFSIYALVYTVDFYYGEYEFNLEGEGSILLSQVFEALHIEADLEGSTASFTDESLLRLASVKRDGTVADWRLTSLEPFTSDETLTVVLKNGVHIEIAVTDAQYTTDLADVFKELQIYKNGAEQDLDAPIVVRDGDTFRLKLSFEEHDVCQFTNNSSELMYFDLPEQFQMDHDFATTTDVSISVGGKVYTLRDNPVRYDPDNHRITFQWNDTDRYAVSADGSVRKLADGEQPGAGEKLQTNAEAFGYLKMAGDTQVAFDITGMFDTTKSHDVSFANSVNIEIANPADAGVEKRGSYDPDSQVATYTVSVRADGDVAQKIDLSDTLGSALAYAGLTKESILEGIQIAGGDGRRSEADTTRLKEAIADTLQVSGSTFSLSIPASGNPAVVLYSGEVVTFSYKATVDLTKVSVSGASPLTYKEGPNGEPTLEKEGVVQSVFDEVGNTIELSNPGNRYDEPDNNTDFWGPTVSFSDLTKVGTVGEVQNGQDSRGNDISYRDISWTVTTNSDMKGTLAGSTITDTVEYITKYVTDLSLEPLTGPDAGIEVLVYEPVVDAEGTVTGEKLVQTRIVPWSKLHVTRGEGVNATGEETRTLTWTYDVPQGDANYKYVINYKNRALVEDIKGPSSVVNVASGRGGVDQAEVPLGPPGKEGIAMTKTAQNASLENIDWDMEVKARTTQYNRYFRVTDTLPYMWIEQDDGTNRMYKDTYHDGDFEDVVLGETTVKSLKAGFLSVDGLQEGEKWTAELVRGNEWTADKLVIRFWRQDDSGNWVEGLADATAWLEGAGSAYKTSVKGKDDAGNEADMPRRKITLHLKTRNNYDPDNPDNWVDLSTQKAASKSWYIVHTNRANVRGDDGDYAYDEAEQNVLKPTIIKKLSPDATWPSGQYDIFDKDTGGYPGYRFLTSVGGVSDTYTVEEGGVRYIVVHDTFDTSKWELFQPAASYDYRRPRAYGGPNANWPSEANGFVEFESAQFRCVPTATGVDFKIRADVAAKRADGTYYPFYSLLYYLVPKADENGSHAQAMSEIVQEALQDENKVERAYEVCGVAKYQNTATLDGVGSMVANYEYEYNPAGKKILSTNGNVVTYELTLNASRAQLLSDEEKQAGKKLEMVDDHSANMSIDYESIKIYVNDEAEPDTQGRVTYDYSGYRGTFQVPDQTKVRIVYDAKLVAAPGTELDFWNETTMSGYSTRVEERKVIESSSTSSAGVYQIRLHKYAMGNLGGGLSGATFRLLDADKNPMTVQNPAHADYGKEIVFETPAGTNGYVTVELDESELGVHLKKNTPYYLQETVAPSEQVDGKTVFYKQDATLYSFLFNDNPDYTAPDGIYRYSNGDEMKVRNFVDRGGINISKLFAGNVELTDEQKANIVFQIQAKLEGGQEAPEGAKTVTDGGDTWYVVQEVRYSDFKYSDWTEGDGDAVSGNYHYELTDEDVGKTFRVVETVYAYQDVTGDANAEVASVQSYMVDGESAGSATRAVTVEQENIGERSHTYVLTNTYFEKKYTIEKVDGDSGARLAGAKFGVFVAQEDGAASGAAEPVHTYVTGDDGKLEIHWSDGYDADTLYYATEVEPPAGYALPESPERFYFGFSSDGQALAVSDALADQKVVDLNATYGSARVSNDKATVSVPARKTWGLTANLPWPAGVKYLRLGLYQQEEGSNAEPAPVQRDGEAYTLLLNADAPQVEFTGLPGAADSGKRIIYSVQELGISYDGTTEVDPAEAYTVTYSAETGEDAAPDVLVVNNTDRGASIEVTKQWFEKRDDGTTARIENPVGDEYVRTFHLYRTTEKKSFNSTDAVVSSISPAGRVLLTEDSDTVFEPGDTVEYYAEKVDPSKNANFHIQSGSWNDIACYGENGWWSSSSDGTASGSFTIPENNANHVIYLRNYNDPDNPDRMTIVRVTLKVVRHGSTASALLTRGANESVVDGMEEVDTFTLSMADGWTYSNDGLDKYDADGFEYYYWVEEEGARDDTSYAYRNGDVAVSNYKQTTSMSVQKTWEAQDHPNGILFDLYRTTDTIEGSQQLGDGERKIELRLWYKNERHDELLQEKYLVVKAGDRIRISEAGMMPMPESQYEGFDGSGDSWKQGKWDNYVKGIYNYAFDVGLYKNKSWSGSDQPGYIWRGNSYWRDSSDYVFPEIVVTEEDIEGVEYWGVNLFQQVPQSISIVNLDAAGSTMQHAALSEYAPGGAHGDNAELVSTVALAGTEWTSDGMVLPKYDEQGRLYHYFALEHVMPGFEPTYEVKDGKTVINNAPVDVEHGAMDVTKELSGLPDDLRKEKTFRFTVSQNGYYFDTSGGFGTDASAEGFTHELSWNEQTGSYNTVHFENLPAGSYEVREVLDGEQGAQVPQYQLASSVQVGGQTASNGMVEVGSNAAVQATIRNVYTRGVEQTSIAAEKVWKDVTGKVLDAADIPAHSSVTLVLRRYLEDGTEDVYSWNPDDHRAVLDGQPDGAGSGELSPWRYVWNGLDKVYWEYEPGNYYQGEYKEYRYEVTEATVSFDGVTSDLARDKDSWLVTTDRAGDGTWTLTNMPGKVSFTFHKVWLPMGESMEPQPWQKDITVKLYQEGQGREVATYRIGMQGAALAAVGSRGAPVIRVNAADGYDYSFTIIGLPAGKVYSVIEDDVPLTQASYGKVDGTGVTVTGGLDRATGDNPCIINRDTGGVALPNTGGAGTDVLRFAGLALVAFGAALAARALRPSQRRWAGR